MKIFTKIISNMEMFTTTERRIADYIVSSYDKIPYLRLVDVSVATSTGDATIIRFCKKLGNTGFSDLRLNIALEQKSQSVIEKNRLAVCDYILTISQSITKHYINSIVECLNKAERVFIFGNGSLSSSALDMEYYLCNYFRITAVISSEYQHIYASLASDRDLIIILAAINNYSSNLVMEKSNAQIIKISNFSSSIFKKSNELLLQTNCIKENKFLSDLLLDKIFYLFITNLILDSFSEGYSSK